MGLARDGLGVPSYLHARLQSHGQASFVMMPPFSASAQRCFDSADRRTKLVESPVAFLGLHCHPTLQSLPCGANCKESCDSLPQGRGSFGLGFPEQRFPSMPLKPGQVFSIPPNVPAALPGAQVRNDCIGLHGAAVLAQIAQRRPAQSPQGS